ncbi:MAG: D-glycerate dehydrogenase [Thiomonas arsenitoxydans]|jgi:gluconate 2-dehydrogenase|uniref:D-glycerate dehydrogenase n=1 Tax=Thiomonas arsenitoxydans (strain DSM 22701 / CIP 110005 / 3As) TaxID=426114 RepID=A0A8I1MZW5_THIA3|nr:MULTISPECIES: D-glycerate dehydrogenase [Thiomonas]MBN8745369.1 D-glycerate dehydrogenase [Thiomonas arsenitoxydans]ODU97595.1 MAG: D-glycerate dehydrogenase [Thiomonas sp. SCN 64-16]
MSNLVADGPLRVLVARAVFPDVIEPLRAVAEVETTPDDAIATPEALRQRLADKHGAFITGSERIDAALLDACPQLLVVSTMTVGVDHIDLAACAERGVIVTHAPDVLTETTADFGFALLLAAARQVGEAERYLRAGQWKKWSVDLFAGADVHGATLGIVGMGRIGQAIARRAAHGFNMRVLYHNRKRLAAHLEDDLRASYRELPELLRESRHVLLALPYSPAAYHLIGATELAQMQPGATLVNIARGGVVDEAALAHALHSGHLGAAGLDVFEGEPAVNPALLAAPRLVLTPHIASSSIPTRRAMAQLAVDNLVAVLQGQPPITPVTG